MTTKEPKKKVLLLDDSRTILDLIGLVLEQAGFEVALLSKPSELPAALRREPPDVVVTDVGLPGLTRLELTNFVRTEILPHCPVILYSGRTGPELVELVEETGAAAFAEKGPGGEDLIRAIRAVLE